MIPWSGTRGDGDGMLHPGELLLESDDLRRDFERLRARGVRFLELAPEDHPLGVGIAALDPDGNRISRRQTRRSQ